MKKALLLCCLFFAAPAFAQGTADNVSSIVAVVNDEVISSLDLEIRLKLIFATTHLQDTPEVREHLRPQVLRALIDERLQLQEAAKNGVTATDEDVAHAVEGIERDRGIPPGGMLSRLDEMGVPRAAFLDQVRARVAWTKLVLKTVRPRVKVSDDEIERERGKAAAGGGNGAEVQLEVLALPVDKPEREQQVKELADKLAEGVRGGASFESVARELGGVAQTSDPFWVPVSQLDPALAAALRDAKAGSMNGPVRTADGYTLVRLMARRAGQGTPAVTPTEVVFKDILLALKPGAAKQDAQQMFSLGEAVAKNPGTCSEEGIAGIANPQEFDIRVAFRRERLDDLPGQVRDIISQLSVGGVSAPYAAEGGIQLFMLCERVEKPGLLGDRDEIGNRLLQQKLELEALKYLRNIRRDATIDVRG